MTFKTSFGWFFVYAAAMLFIASKLLQAFTQPLFWLALLWAGALLWLGWARTASQRRVAMGGNPPFLHGSQKTWTWQLT